MAIFLFLNLVFALVATAQQPLTICNYGKNFTRDREYRGNLDSALASLAAEPDIRYGFHSLYSGQYPDTAYALVLCRGDVDTPACRNCTTASVHTASRSCPDQMEAVAWYDFCMLRYSNESMSGVLRTEPSIFVWKTDSVNADHVLFIEALTSLFDGLKGKVSKGGPLKKYDTGSTAGPTPPPFMGSCSASRT